MNNLIKQALIKKLSEFQGGVRNGPPLSNSDKDKQDLEETKRDLAVQPVEKQKSDTINSSAKIMLPLIKKLEIH